VVWWAVLLISAGMAALGQLLQPKIADAKPEDNLRTPTNDETRPLPVPWGEVLVAPQLLDRGDFKAVPIKKRIFTGFWFKSIVEGYRYYIGLILGICYAKNGDEGALITGVIWRDRYVWEKPLTAEYFNSILVDEPTFWGAEKQEGGLFGRFNFYPGAEVTTGGGPIPVEPSAYWESLTGVDMPDYHDVCYAEWLGYSQTEDDEHLGYVGNSGSLEDILFRVKRFPGDLPLSGGVTIGTNSNYCNPIFALYECFVNSDFGMGLANTRMNLTSWDDAADTVRSEARGWNYLWDRQSSIEEMANEILRYVNGVVYTDLATGEIAIALAREASTVGLGHLDKSSFLEAPQVNRPHWSETKNQVFVKYTDQSTILHDVKSVEDLDLNNFDIQGVKIPATVEHRGCPTEELALLLAAESRRTLATPLLRLSGRLNRKAYNYHPGTRFIYDDPTEDITDVVMIVNRVKYGTIIDGAITIEAIEDIFAYGTASYGPATKIVSDPFGDPAQATLYGALEVPYWFQRDDLNRPLVYAARPNEASITYDVALDGEIQPDEIAFAPTGTLENDYEQLTDPTDNSGTLVIGSLVDESELENVSAALIASEAAQLIYFESTGELAAFESFTDNLDGTITLNNVWRGVIDTPPMAHSAGERVWFLSYGLGLNELNFDGSIVIKFLPKSVRSAISLAATTASTTLNEADRASRPYPVRYVTLGGSYTNEFQDTGDVVLAWRESNRLTETTVVKQDNTTATPEDDTTYEIDIYGEDDTLIRAVTGLTAATYTYTNANELSDTGKARLEFFITAKIFSKRDGLRSKHSWDRKVFRIDPDSFARITRTSDTRVTRDGKRRTIGI
jgi:hypothetical protein